MRVAAHSAANGAAHGATHGKVGDGAASSINQHAVGGGNRTYGQLIELPRSPSVATLRARLGSHPARLLVLEDALGSFGGWGGDGGTDAAGVGSVAAAEVASYHEDAQKLLSNWCCTADERFKRLAGVIPYILPPLEGQSAWRGHAHLRWAAQGLTEVFEKAGESAAAAWVRPPT